MCVSWHFKTRTFYVIHSPFPTVEFVTLQLNVLQATYLRKEHMEKVPPRKLTAGGPQNVDGLEKVTPFKNGHLVQYLC